MTFGNSVPGPSWAFNKQLQTPGFSFRMGTRGPFGLLRSPNHLKVRVNWILMRPRSVGYVLRE